MKNYLKTSLVLLFAFLASISLGAKEIEVSSQVEFENALKAVAKNDVIVWLPGTYSDVLMNISKSQITVQAKLSGETIFTGKSWLHVTGSNVRVEGFQFIDCLLYTSPSPRDRQKSRMPSSA